MDTTTQAGGGGGELRANDITPERIAALLKEAGLSEDDVLDLLLETARRFGGWNSRLDAVGLAVLKPDALAGQRREA